MKSNFALILFSILLLFPFTVKSEKTGAEFIIQGTVTSKTEGAIIGASVAEIDVNNRVVGGNITDINGHYVLKLKNTANHLSLVISAM